MPYMNNPYMNLYPSNSYNNYMNYNQLPNQMQNQQMINNSLSGQMVADFNEVSSKNTPLDGSSSYFPLVDGSAIYCKKLNVNTGASQLFVYKLVEQENQTNNKDDDKAISSTLFQISSELQELKDIVLENFTKPQLPKLNFGKGGEVNE